MVLRVLRSLLGHFSMSREVSADTMNSTLLSSKTVKSKGKQIFLSTRKVWENWKMEWNTRLWVRTQISIQPFWLLPTDRHCNCNYSHMIELAPINFQETARSSTAVRKAIISVNVSDNLVKLSWTRATNPASTQELKHRLEKTSLKPNIALRLFRRWENNLNTCPGISHSGDLIW